MRMAEVNKILLDESKCTTYIVGFDSYIGDLLVRDFFPDVLNGEQPLKTKALAVALAKKFADKTKDRFYNVHVADSETRLPISTRPFAVGALNEYYE